MIKKILLIIITLFTINKNLYSKEITTKNYFLNYNNNIYLGGKLGISNFMNLKYLDNNFKIINTKIEKNKLAFENFIGYKINKVFNLELGYQNLGKALKRGKFINGYFKTKGITLSNKINYNLSPKINIYSKIGWIILKSTSEKINIINNTKDYISYKKISPLTSIGIEYKINNNFNTRLNYQFIYNLGNKNIFHEEPNNNLLTVSLIYNINNINSNIKNNKFFKIKNNNFSINYFKNILNLIKKKKIKIKYIIIKNINSLNNSIYLNLKNIIKKTVIKKNKEINFIKIKSDLYKYKNFKCYKFKKNNIKLYKNCLNYLNNKVIIKIYIK